MRGLARTREPRVLLILGTLLLFLLLACVPLGGALLPTAVVLLVLLAVVVTTHYRWGGRLRQQARETRRPLLASPLQVAVALLLVIVVGSLAAIGITLLASVIGGFAGNGRTLLRLLLVTFVLAPCLSVGSRCGRWWAFSGSILLSPAAIVCALVAGLGFSQAAVDVLLVVAATALATAAGSLHTHLTGVGRPIRTRGRRTPDRHRPAPSTRVAPDVAVVSLETRSSRGG